MSTKQLRAIAEQQNPLPTRYSPSQVRAKKTFRGYVLYWTGTENEVFPGELFRSPQEARMTLRAVILAG